MNTNTDNLTPFSTKNDGLFRIKTGSYYYITSRDGDSTELFKDDLYSNILFPKEKVSTTKCDCCDDQVSYIQITPIHCLVMDNECLEVVR